jgi:Na+/H+ antiporter NhaA
MSLFISGLAFTAEASLLAAKVGILGGSLVAGLIGSVLVRTALRRAGALSAVS